MLKFYYNIFTVVLVVLIIVGFNYYSNKTNQSSKKKNLQIRLLAGGLILWGIYLSILSKTGVLRNFDFPPRFPLLILLPAFTFVITFLIRNRKSQIIDKIPVHIPVLFESFRIPVELLLHGTFLAGIIPIETTYSGYNFEIYFAASALIMGLLVYKKMISKKIILIWNIIGLGFLATILVIFLTAIFFPQVWGNTTSMVSLDLGTFPYMLVPAFYVPLAILMHGISIIQATRR